MTDSNVVEIVVKGRRDASTDRAFNDTQRAADRAGQGISDTFAGLKGKLALAGAAAGLALVAGLGEALSQGKLAAKTAAQLGRPDDVKMFGAVAGKAYTEGFADSVEQGQEALRAIMGANIVPEDAGQDEIQALTDKALVLANVFDQDLGQSVSAAQQLIRNGLAKDATQAFDLITRGIQQGVDKSGDLNDTLIEYSTQFRELGISGPKALGLMSQGLKAGARDADTVADAIKEFAIRSKDGSALSAEAFKSIGLNSKEMFKTFASGGPGADKAMATVIQRIKEMKDPVEQDATAVALFGTKAEDLQDALFALDPTTAVDAMGNIAGATDKAGQTFTDTAQNDVATFGREVKQKVVDMLEQHVIPKIRDVVRVIREDWIPAIQATIAWVKENQAWLVPLLTALASMIVLYKTVAAATAAWEVVQGLLNGTMRKNPILAVISVIVGLITWLVTAYQASETFRNKVRDALEAVKGAFTRARDWVVEKLQSIIGFFQSIAKGISEFFAPIFNAITAPFRAAYKWIQDRASTIASIAFGDDSEIAKAARRRTAQLDAMNNPPQPVGGSNFKNKPRVPGSAHGGIASGLREVGEYGRELVQLPAGSRVYNHQETARMMAGGGGATSVELSFAAGAERGLVRAIIEMLRYEVRTKGRGDTQRYFGQAAA